jgi:hypothetical protein
MTTTFSNKALILADLWLNYREDEEFIDFCEYNDLGLPLSYAIANGIVDNPNELAIKFVEETFDLLLAGLEIQEDSGYETLDDLLSAPMGD